MKNHSLGSVLVLAAFLLGSCTSMGTLPRPEAGKPVMGDTVTLVGRVSIDPEVVQVFTGLDAESKKKMMGGRFFAMLSRKPIDFGADFTPEFTIDDKLNEYFLATVPRGPLSWFTVLVYREFTNSTTRQLMMNSPFAIVFQPEDKFVYLGDFVFRLSVTNELGGKSEVLEISDRYAEAKAELEGTILGPDGIPFILQKRIPSPTPSLHVDTLATRTSFYPQP